METLPHKNAGWVSKLIGKPWEPAGRGPDTFDCWGLVWHIYREQLSIDLPKFQDVDAAALRAVLTRFGEGFENHGWARVPAPGPFDVVATGNGARLHHVGLFLPDDGGLVLHCERGRGVVAQPLREIKKRNFQRLEFYNHPKIW